MTQFNLPPDKGVVFNMEDWQAMVTNQLVFKAMIENTAIANRKHAALTGVVITGSDVTTWEVTAGYLLTNTGEVFRVDAQSIPGVPGEGLWGEPQTIDGPGEPHGLNDGTGFSGTQVVKTIRKMVFGSNTTGTVNAQDIVQGFNLVPGKPTAWQAATVINGWAGPSTISQPLQFRREGDRVVFDGAIGKDGANTTNVHAFTLPVGFRPSRTLHFFAFSLGTGGDLVASVTIATNGQVTIDNYAALAAFAEVVFDLVSFRL